MDWMEEVRENLKKRRQILFSKDAACLQPLAAQLAQQPHTVLVLWALAWAEETVDTLEARYPQERRPREALEAARQALALSPEDGRIRDNVAFLAG